MSKHFIQNSMQDGIFYGIANRVWSLCAGVITILLLAKYLSSAALGYFYTFRSLLTLQVFFELGLTTCLASFFSHEFAELYWGPNGQIEGSAVHVARCWKIFNSAIRLFRILAILFFCSLLVFGYLFFSQYHSQIHWVLPWSFAVIFAAVFLYFTPHMALIMGSGRTQDVYAVWLIGSMIGSLSGWILLKYHLGLYAVMAGNAGNVIAIAVYLFKFRRKLLHKIVYQGDVAFSWRKEIWPMQWRMAVTWMSGYFIYPLFTPVLFHYWGPAVAGRMGMTLNASNAILGICLVVINIRLPEMGKLIALQKWVALDKVYRFTLIISITAGILGTISGSILIAILQTYAQGLGSHFLPWRTAGIIFICVINTVYNNAAGTYLRAHKAEPLMWQSLIVALIQAAGTLWAGKYYGATGEAISFLMISLLINFPVTFISRRYYKTKWHTHNSSQAYSPIIACNDSIS